MSTEILTLTENSNAHGTEALIQRQRDEGLAEVVYALGDAGGYYGVVASVGITQDADGDYHLVDHVDHVEGFEYYRALDDAIDAGRRWVANAVKTREDD